MITEFLVIFDTIEVEAFATTYLTTLIIIRFNVNYSLLLIYFLYSSLLQNHKIAERRPGIGLVFVVVSSSCSMVRLSRAQQFSDFAINLSRKTINNLRRILWETNECYFG